MEEKTAYRYSFHLAGIVPIMSQPSDFNMPWHDCLMPISPNYTAIERCIIELAYSGVETIWIVANDDVSPLIRYRLGEWVNDPNFVFDSTDKRGFKRIPIFYVPLNSIDRGKRDCLAWNALYGAWAGYWVARRFSKWVIPDRYLVSFPYGVYPENIGLQSRRAISSTSAFYVSHNGKTVKDGEFLSFSFNGEQFKKYKRLIREKSMEGYKLRLDEVFGSDIIENDATIVESSWYYPIENWENYCKFLSSEERKQIKEPSNRILTRKSWNNGIGDED